MDLAIRSAMRAPQIAAEPVAVPQSQDGPLPRGDAQPQFSAQPQSGPSARRRFGLFRRLLAPLLGPLAHYARRYLQASVVHQLNETRDHLTAVVQHQLHETRAQLTAVSQDQLHEARTHLTAVLQDQLNETRAQLTAVSQELLQVNDRLEKALEAVLRRQDTASEVLLAVVNQLSVIQTQGARTSDDLIRLPGLFGPRFDEIEIKLRPLVPYDDESIALRMHEGYIVAPRSSPNFVTMLANASSRGLEPGTRDVLRRLIQPGMTVADIGANIGLLTLVCAWATGPSGRVIAFEPEAVPRANLNKMLSLNGLSWVEVRDQAVGAAAGRLTFHVSDIIGHSSLYALPEDEEARARIIEVEVLPLDKVLAGKRLDVAKIDVEGAELDVLAGMVAALKDNPDLAIVAEFGPVHVKRVGQTPAGWFKAFAQAGFKPYMINETTGDCEPCTAASAAKVVSANIAFVRPGGDAQRRLLKL